MWKSASGTTSRFLERFMDEDFPDEEESEDGDEGEIFEEL